MTYKTSLDNLAKIVTVSLTVIFATIIILQITLISDGENRSPIFTMLALLIIYFGTFSFRPIGYTLSEKGLTIHRPLVNVTIPKNEIKSVNRLTKNELSWTVRTFGVGGLFGYFGKFSNYKLGSMTWYATKRKENMVLVTTINDHKIVLSPNDADKFITEFS